MTRLIGLLLIALFVAITARRLRLPYTVGVVMSGIALPFSPFHAHAALTRDIIVNVVRLAVLGALITAVFLSPPGGSRTRRAAPFRVALRRAD